MPRLSESDLTRIKAISLLEILAREGVVLKAQGKDFVTCCVFHDDTTASLTISPDKNLYHCFGCGAAGSPIDWLMKRRGLSFRAACDALQVEYGLMQAINSHNPLNTPTQQDTAMPYTATPLALSLTADMPDQTLLHAVVDYYHRCLLGDDEARKYLARRGLDDTTLIETFKLGYANRTLGYRLPERQIKTGNALRNRLQGLGLLRDSGHEHFAGSIVMPIMGTAGEVHGLYGRKVLDNLRQGTAYHLYNKGAHKGVWNASGLTNSSPLILCEAIIDAMSYWVCGLHNVTASYGVRGFTHDHVVLLKRLGITQVLIAYDADEAGDTAARELAQQLQGMGIASSRVLYARGLDANDYIKPSMQNGKANGKSQLLACVEQACYAFTQKSSALPPVPLPLSPLSGLAAPVSPSAVSVAVGVDLVHSTSSSTSTNNGASEYLWSLEGRRYRVRGLEQNIKSHSDEVLKVQLAVMIGDVVDGRLHLDKVDMYSHKQRQAFVFQAAEELGLAVDLLKRDMGQLLLMLEQQRHELSLQALAQDSPTPLTAEQSQAALDLLTSPNLAERILSDFNAAGVVGEDANKLVGYLACVSRKLDRPLAILIQSSSAAGKSSLMDAILQFMPEDERVQYSAMTGQSLYYMGENDLKHKILAISEEEGAHQASYALKLLQSEGKVKIASAGKDDATGKLTTQEYEVEGPVMLMMTTTAIDIDEELLNRCLVLSVNEGRAQTEAIHHMQRSKRTLEGLQAKVQSQQIKQTHQHAQSMLSRLTVINPYAQQLTFNSSKTRSRRDHEKYLTLIDAIALLHQKQRTIHRLDVAGQVVHYVEVMLSDIELANRLAIEVLGRTLDELPPQTRKLLHLIETEVKQAVQGVDNQPASKQSHYLFSRKQIRAWCGWSDTQLKVHLDRLCDMEYMLSHKGSKGKSYVYELLYQGEGADNSAFVMGLLDVTGLKNTTTTPTSRMIKPSSRGDLPEVAGLKRGENGGVTAFINPPQGNNNKALSHNLTA